MIIGTLLPTVAATQRNHAKWCALYNGSWSIDDHINWYLHCKSRGAAFFRRRWGNVKAAVSRNKREGKYLASVSALQEPQYVAGWGWAGYEYAKGRKRAGGPKS